MTVVTPLAFNDRLVRAVMQDDEAWFVGIDVCRALEIRDHKQALGRLDEDEKGVHTVETHGGPQSITIVSEQGVYQLVFRSQKPEAARFRRWLAHDVLPTLRRTGQFTMPSAAPRVDVAEVGPLRERELNIERVRIAARLWGLPAARRLWIDIGEPDFTAFQQSSAERSSADTAPEVRLVADAIRAMVARPAFQDGWTGSATTLHAVLREIAGTDARRSDWPGSAQKLGIAISRVNPLLVDDGVRIVRRRSGTRQITILTEVEDAVGVAVARPAQRQADVA